MRTFLSVAIEGPLIPLEPLQKTTSSRQKVRLHSPWDMYYVRRGWSGDLPRISQTSRTCQPPNESQTVQAPGSRTRRKAVGSMCRQISQTDRSSSNSHAAKCPPGEARSKMKKKQRIPFSKKKKVKTCGRRGNAPQRSLALRGLDWNTSSAFRGIGFQTGGYERSNHPKDHTNWYDLPRGMAKTI